MCRVQLIVVLTCALGVVDADIQPDWDKLTDFSTHYTLALDASELSSLSLAYASYKRSGEMNVDVFGEKAYFKSHASYTSVSGVEGHDSCELYFDGVTGHVAFKAEGTLPAPNFGLPGDIVLEPSCVKIRFQQGMLPPPDMVKEQVEQNEPMIAQQLQQTPHTEVTVDGESVQLFDTSPSGPPNFGGPVVGLHDDATPVGVSIEGRDRYHADGKWTPELKFTDWSQGSNIPDDMTCTEMSPEELLANPIAKRSLRMLERVMALARRVQPLQLAFQHLPAKPSLLLESAASASRSVQTSAPGMMPTMVLAFAVGTLASLLVFAVLKPRRSQGTPLLENIA